MATTRAMGRKPHERAKAVRNSIRQKSPSKKVLSEQQAIERLGLRNLSPTSKKRVIQGKAPAGYMSLENYAAKLQEKIQAELENKALKLAQRRNLLQEEDRIRGELNAMSPNSPSPPRARSAKNPGPRSPRQARYYNKLKQLYTTGRAKKVEEAKMAYKKKMMKNATMKPNREYINNPVYTKKMMELRARALKPRKRKKPTSPTIAQIQRNLLANRSPRRRKRSRVLPKPNAATAKNARRARIEKRRGLVQIKKRYTLTDLITGKKKTFTKKGWYDRAVAKQQSLKVRICA